MKNLKSQKTIIFLSNKKIAIVVFNTICNKNNVLYANEVSVNEDNIQATLSNLLTNAANFLGSNIKTANLVFEDFDMRLNTINKEFDNCSSKEEVIKQIYSDARQEGNFVNNIIFANDDLDFSKPIQCKTLVSKYSKYNQFKKMVTYCNVKLQSCANIATLLNNNKDEFVVTVNNESAVVCNYSNNTLNNCNVVDINFNNIVNVLSKQFNTSAQAIAKEAKIANILVKNGEYNFDLAWNYDLKNRSLSSINAVEFVKNWRIELLNQIQNGLNINDWTKVKVIANNELNNFNSTQIKNSILGLDAISDKFAIAFSNINKIPEIESQAKYESQYESDYERVLA